MKPTDVYRLGVGDVLRISLVNAGGAGNDYAVDADGSIDFPLAGEDPVVLGMTVAEAEQALSSKVTLYSDARVSITVRDYASHKITVTGLAAITGERSLRREAMPLFAIRSEAGVDPSATRVIIRRGGMASLIIFPLNSDATGGVLVYPGDVIEFAADVKTR